MNHLIRRGACPGCTLSESEVLYTCAYNQTPIKSFLEDFYGSCDRREFEFLRDDEYTVRKCPSCDLVFQEYVPDPDLVERLYDLWIDASSSVAKHEQKYALGELSDYAHEILVVLCYFRSKNTTLNLLDFGMGWGGWCLMAKAFGCNVHGTEISSKRIEYARKNSLSVLEWPEIFSQRFDCINLEQVLEHLTDPRGTLTALTGQLTPGGLIKINVPNGRRIPRLLRNPNWNLPRTSTDSLIPIFPLEHVNCFTHESLIRFARSCGLEPVTMPLAVQYRSAVNWTDRRHILKNIIGPLHRNFLARDTYLFFRKRRQDVN